MHTHVKTLHGIVILGVLFVASIVFIVVASQKFEHTFSYAHGQDHLID